MTLARENVQRPLQGRLTMLRRTCVRLSFVTLLLVAAAVPAAFAQLERVGPVDLKHGYPAWYQDKTGIALEFCTPVNQAELNNG